MRSVGEFQLATADSALPPGRDIAIELEDGASFEPGTTGVVSLGAEVPPSPAVPALAVRSDAQGTYVLAREGAEEPRRVDVEVVRSSGGWSAIEVQDLAPGTLILVGP